VRLAVVQFWYNFSELVKKPRIWRRRVGVENITVQNLKDLEGMLGNTKSLKRNNRKCKGILIVPSMAPRFEVTPSTVTKTLGTLSVF
jgi:hypothetical protein